jgi:hypothetical protein
MTRKRTARKCCAIKEHYPASAFFCLMVVLRRVRSYNWFAMRLVLSFCLVTVVSNGQWLNQQTSGIRRTADGKPNLVAPAPRTPDGKPDLAGMWSNPSDRYYNNIAADLKPGDVLPAADALYRQRVSSFSKDAMESLCLPLGPAAMTGPYRDSRIVQTPSLFGVVPFIKLPHKLFLRIGIELWYPFPVTLGINK